MLGDPGTNLLQRHMGHLIYHCIFMSWTERFCFQQTSGKNHTLHLSKLPQNRVVLGQPACSLFHGIRDLHPWLGVESMYKESEVKWIGAEMKSNST